MIELHDNPKLVDVWATMADHFLDTETRHDIPLTALCCIEARLSVDEARDVWRYEVSPAVGFNLCDVAGEWMGWDRDWLVERIESLRKRWNNAPWAARAVRYHVRTHVLDGVWRAIARHIEVLLGVEGCEAREQVARDMVILARHAFDFCPPESNSLPEDVLNRLKALFPEPFMHAMAPAFVGRDEERAARLRIDAALQGH